MFVDHQPYDPNRNYIYYLLSTMVYTSEKNRRLNSILRCDPFCKPSSPLDKSTQRGKPLVVSRANPNFCASCGVRHASISCSALDPVSEDIPSNPIPHPPSKWRDCELVSRHTTTTVLDGVQQMVTQTKIRLCPTHLVPDSTPPPPEVDPPAPELDLSISTELILDSLTTDIDPLNVLHSPPQQPFPDDEPSPSSELSAFTAAEPSPAATDPRSLSTVTRCKQVWEEHP